MTPATRWWGAPLDEDQRELQSMLDGFIAAHPVLLDDEAETVTDLVSELAGLGVWTLGTAESCGGGGADAMMTTVVWERLGRVWPALGWASVQAHAAVDILAGDDPCAELVAALHAGSAAVAVVDARSIQVKFSRGASTLTGSVARIDAASEAPYLLILVDHDEAVLVPPSAMVVNPLRRSGLGGAFTRSVEVDTSAAEALVVTGIDNPAARARLRFGAAVLAAGIAGAAADAALAYTAGRRQFGGQLTEIPTVRQSLLRQYSAAAVILHAVAATSNNPDAAYAVMRAGCDDAIDAAAAALQSHGGYGYLVEYPAERHLRDAVSLRAAVDTWSAAAATAAAVSGYTEQTTPWQDAS